MTSRRPRPYARHGCSSSRRRLARAVRGFTLIELVVAMAILLVVMIGVLSAISFAYTSSTDTEMRNTAKNIAMYTLEYLRARTVTNDVNNLTLYNALNPSGSPSTGTYRWYSSSNLYGALPSMIDVGNLPLQSNGYPCNYTSTWVRTATGTPLGKKDGDSNPSDTISNAIVAGSQPIDFTSKHAALPTDTYSTTPLAWATTLQGYASVRDISDPGVTVNPAVPEDGNLARMDFSTSSNTAAGTYRTTLTGAWTDLMVRYPGAYPSTQPVIASFTPLTNYVARVYTTDPNRIDKTKQKYNPYYTNAATGTQAYRGLRVLTQIVARSTVASLDADGFRHVQYYDVTVTVLWMNGTHESSYDLASQIVAY